MTSSGSSATVRACRRSGSHYVARPRPVLGPRRQERRELQQARGRPADAGRRRSRCAAASGERATPGWPPGPGCGWTPTTSGSTTRRPRSTTPTSGLPADGRWDSAEKLLEHAGVQLRAGDRLQRVPDAGARVGHLLPRRPRARHRRLRLAADQLAAARCCAGSAPARSWRSAEPVAAAGRAPAGLEDREGAPGVDDPGQRSPAAANSAAYSPLGAFLTAGQHQHVQVRERSLDLAAGATEHPSRRPARRRLAAARGRRCAGWRALRRPASRAAPTSAGTRRRLAPRRRSCRRLATTGRRPRWRAGWGPRRRRAPGRTPCPSGAGAG